MRPAILAALAGGLLLTVAGCDDKAATPEAAAPAPATSSAEPSTAATLDLPDYSADTRRICTRLERVFDREVKDFGAAMGKMIAYREARDSAKANRAALDAAAELKSAGTQVRTATAAARDPEFKLAGATSAAKLERSAADRRYISRVRTTADLNRTIETQLADWVSPVLGYCA